jgi:hypothetical protein
MAQILTTGELGELIEDRLEQDTGEPRHVTDIEIEVIPEQGDAPNWSANTSCKREYRTTLNAILGQLQREHPRIKFG